MIPERKVAAETRQLGIMISFDDSMLGWMMPADQYSIVNSVQVIQSEDIDNEFCNRNTCLPWLKWTEVAYYTSALTK